MKEREGRAWAMVSETSRKLIFMTCGALLLCTLSFYAGGVFFSLLQNNSSFSVDDRAEHLSIDIVCAGDQIAGGSADNFTFLPCDIEFQDYTPCTDPKRWDKYDRKRLAFMERHCPPESERMECLIPPPDGYQPPLTWPKSRDECWYRNVPYEWINNVKANQHWLKKEGDKFIFPGGGTMFPRGVGKYLDAMEELIPGMKDGSIRTALDTGCGVASWGGYLLDRGILTVSLAPRDQHQAQVQFALERGIPAMLGVISTHRLPFPSAAFDMAHCSRCLIPWTDFGGILLMEIDRILRPGGFWVLSGPPINYENHIREWGLSTDKEKSNLDAIKNLLEGMCYKLYNQKGDIAVWQKPTDSSCYQDRGESAYPPKCDDSIEPDTAWYVPMRPCLVTESTLPELAVGKTPKWPKRLNATPGRLRAFRARNQISFEEDKVRWRRRVDHYKNLLPELGSEKIRNVMDMNTLYAGLAAALFYDPVWIMNVVSSYARNSLPIIYDRGLIGTVHDWCEAFSTYPRTYDLLHMDGHFSNEGHRCDMKVVLLEMDRILRPEGYVIMRDTSVFLQRAARIAEGMRWKCEMNLTEDGEDLKERILLCQKTYWQFPQFLDER